MKLYVKQLCLIKNAYLRHFVTFVQYVIYEIILGNMGLD